MNDNMKTINQISEEYARKAHLASGVNPSLIESVIYEALTEFNNSIKKEAEKSVCCKGNTDKLTIEMCGKCQSLFHSMC